MPGRRSAESKNTCIHIVPNWIQWKLPTLLKKSIPFPSYPTHVLLSNIFHISQSLTLKKHTHFDPILLSEVSSSKIAWSFFHCYHNVQWLSAYLLYVVLGNPRMLNRSLFKASRNWNFGCKILNQNIKKHAFYTVCSKYTLSWFPATNMGDPGVSGYCLQPGLSLSLCRH